MKRIAVVGLALGIIGFAACGGDDAAPPTTRPGTVTAAGASTTTQAATTTATSAAPGELGDQIGELYLAAYDDVIALLADRPDAASAATELATLKEQYIQQFVVFGHQREALGEADRATVDAHITLAVDTLPDDTYDAYQQAWTDYRSDAEMAELIAAFNIIGQYANFDLLREQAPQEAARLGVAG